MLIFEIQPKNILLSITKGLSNGFYKLVKHLNFTVYRRTDAVIIVTNNLAKYLATYGVKTFLAPSGADISILLNKIILVTLVRWLRVRSLDYGIATHEIYK